MNSNYWAAIPIPGAKVVGAVTKDRKDLGAYNKEVCWTKSCVNEKLEASRREVASQCPAEAAAPSVRSPGVPTAAVVSRSTTSLQNSSK